eukprot:m.444035 g.444035  ORF g.444035 m.444035 type:complete len:577 (+) comp19038_c0_seq1:148-1878(+)
MADRPRHSGAERLGAISRHLSGAAVAAPVEQPVGDRLCTLEAPPTPKQQAFMAFMRMACDDQTNTEFDYEAALPGPLDDPAIRAIPDKKERYLRVIAEGRKHNGKNQVYGVEMAERYAGGINNNYVNPTLLVARGNKPFLTWIINVMNNKDAERLARTHVKKSLLYDNTFLRDGVLSNRDNKMWREQRFHLVEAFLPRASLTKIFPVSLERCKDAMYTRLPEVTAGFTKPLEIWEFWLNEAMAQLQLALLGETKQTEAKTNKMLRNAFGEALFGGGSETDVAARLQSQAKATEFILDYSANLVKRSIDPATGQSRVVGPSFDEGSEVRGPLTAQIATLKESMTTDAQVDRDTAATFLFAGHDTTANLMTWVTFEMARKPHLQRRLQQEVDQVFASLAGRDMTYDDLPQMTFLTRIITETLRLWPSVPNGTFRETEFDDVITGRDGKMVTIPKGTNLMIGEWALHMSEEFWGPDVNEFNPDREFLPEELAGGAVGTNPQSHRYCPFTFSPRSCIGRNFAMMEARVLLAHFFHSYSVTLAEPTLSREPHARDPMRFLGKNIGTMGPDGGMHVNLTQRR